MVKSDLGRKWKGCVTTSVWHSPPVGSAGWELGGVGVQVRSWCWRLEERSEGSSRCLFESSGVIKNVLLLQSTLLRQVEFAWPHWPHEGEKRGENRGMGNLERFPVAGVSWCGTFSASLVLALNFLPLLSFQRAGYPPPLPHLTPAE